MGSLSCSSGGSSDSMSTRCGWRGQRPRRTRCTSSLWTPLPACAHRWHRRKYARTSQPSDTSLPMRPQPAAPARCMEREGGPTEQQWRRTWLPAAAPAPPSPPLVQPQAATSAACCLLADEVGPVAVPPHETDRKILKSAQQGYCIKIPYVPEKQSAAAEIERQLRRARSVSRQRPPSRTPQLRRGAPAAAGCERSSTGPCGGRSTLPAHPRPVVSGASSRW
jgi:hypothetical protein